MGVVSAIVDYGTLQLLMQMFDVQYPIAKAVSFVFGTLTAYLLNRRFTFRAEHSWRKFATVMALYALMFAVQWGIFVPLTAFLLDRGLERFWATTIAYVVAQGVATVTNFVVQRTLIFKPAAPTEVPLPPEVAATPEAPGAPESSEAPESSGSAKPTR